MTWPRRSDFLTTPFERISIAWSAMGWSMPQALVRAFANRTSHYGLTPEAEHLFPKMYGPALRQLMEVLAERLPPKKLDEIIRAAGHRMAAEHRSAIKAKKLQDRVAEALAVLTEGGGACKSEKADGMLIVRCYDCPLTIAAVGHPAICRLLETMLSDLLGVHVKQRCEAAPSPQCCFEIHANGKK